MEIQIPRRKFFFAFLRRTAHSTGITPAILYLRGYWRAGGWSLITETEQRYIAFFYSLLTKCLLAAIIGSYFGNIFARKSWDVFNLCKVSATSFFFLPEYRDSRIMDYRHHRAIAVMSFLLGFGRVPTAPHFMDTYSLGRHIFPVAGLHFLASYQIQTYEKWRFYAASLFTIIVSLAIGSPIFVQLLRLVSQDRYLNECVWIGVFYMVQIEVIVVLYIINWHNNCWIILVPLFFQTGGWHIVFRIFFGYLLPVLWNMLIQYEIEIRMAVQKQGKLSLRYRMENEEYQEEMDGSDRMENQKLKISTGLLRQRVKQLQDVNHFLNENLLSSCFIDQHSSGDPQVDRELNELERRYADVRERLNEAYETIDELTTRVRDGKHDKEVQVDDRSEIEHIHALQEEVIEARARDAVFAAVIKDLKNRADELQKANERFHDASPNLESFQKELDEVQRREIEANMQLKETHEQIRALREDWEAFIAKQPAKNDGDPVTCTELQEEILGACIREADAAAELKENRHRVMELETRNQVLTNQIHRLDEEYTRLDCQSETWPRRERELQCQIRQTQHKFYDTEARCKEEAVMTRLKEAELLDTIAELKHQISEMENNYFEQWTHQELNKENDTFEDGDEDEVQLMNGSTGSTNIMEEIGFRNTPKTEEAELGHAPYQTATAGGCSDGLKKEAVTLVKSSDVACLKTQHVPPISQACN